MNNIFEIYDDEIYFFNNFNSQLSDDIIQAIKTANPKKNNFYGLFQSKSR